MANAKYIVDKIKINGEVQDVIARTTDKYVTVTYKGDEITLASALEAIGNNTPGADIDFASDSEVRNIFTI